MESEIILLKGIKDGNDIVIEKVYKKFFPIIRQYVCTNSGTEDEAKDVFQESFIVLYEKLQYNNENLNCSIKTFLYAVAKRIWLKRLKSTSVISKNSIDVFHEDFDVSEDLAVTDEISENIEKLNAAMKMLGEPCKTILELFYNENKNMQEISNIMNYQNIDSAKTQKYKCLMRLRRFYLINMEKENG